MMSKEGLAVTSALIGASGVVFLIVEILNPYRPVNLWIVAGIVVGVWGLLVLVRTTNDQDK